MCSLTDTTSVRSGDALDFTSVVKYDALLAETLDARFEKPWQSTVDLHKFLHNLFSSVLVVGTDDDITFFMRDDVLIEITHNRRCLTGLTALHYQDFAVIGDKELLLFVPMLVTDHMNEFSLILTQLDFDMTIVSHKLTVVLNHILRILYTAVQFLDFPRSVLIADAGVLEVWISVEREVQIHSRVSVVELLQ